METEAQRKAEAQGLYRQERQQFGEDARRKVEETKQCRVAHPVAAGVALVLFIFSFLVWWLTRQTTEPVGELPPQKQITEPRQEKVEARKEVPLQAPAAHKQDKPILTQPVLSAGKVFREHLKSGGEGPEMVVVPAGWFRMGDVQGGRLKDEIPVRTVRIQPFAIGRYEVTFDEYDRFAPATKRQLPNDQRWGRGRRPIINVSWREAVEYAKWLSEQTGRRYRLPTETEWEYAARAGTETAYWWGKDFVKEMANCSGCGSQWNKQTSPVGSFKPNPFGLYDMVGNVWEPVDDCWHGDYNGAPADGSAWKEAGGGKCAQRVLRGGSWTNIPRYLRSSVRAVYDLGARSDVTGFRLVQDIN